MGITKIKYQPGSVEDVEQKKQLAEDNARGIPSRVKAPTPKANARKIDSNAKKIEKLMAMLKGKK